MPLLMISWLLWPRTLATNPILQASCSCAGWYRPWAGGGPFGFFICVVMGAFAALASFAAHSSASRSVVLELGVGTLPAKVAGVSRTSAQEHTSLSSYLLPEGRESTIQNFDTEDANFRIRGFAASSV